MRLKKKEYLVAKKNTTSRHAAMHPRPSTTSGRSASPPGIEQVGRKIGVVMQPTIPATGSSSRLTHSFLTRHASKAGSSRVESMHSTRLSELSVGLPFNDKVAFILRERDKFKFILEMLGAQRNSFYGSKRRNRKRNHEAKKTNRTC